MPYRNEVQPLNLFGDFLAGKQAAIEQQGAQQGNALRGLQVQRQTGLNALAQDPNATPEQYVRAGDAAGGAALDAINQRGQVDKQQAVQQLAGIAQKALTIQDPAQRKGFLQQAGQIYGPSFQALGADMSQFPAMLQMPDDQLAQRLQQVAQLAAPQKPIEVSKDASLAVQDPNNPAKYTTAYTAPGSPDVTFHDAGDQLIPTLKNGQPAPGVAPIKKGVSPAQQYSPDSVEQTANLIANGQIPALTGYAMRSPWGQQVMARVGELNPEYRSGTNVSQSATMRAFSSGVEGRTVRSLNVAISHLDTLSGLADALDNGDIQRINQAAVLWKTETGNPAPTSFTSARDIVANEVVKAVTASGGSLADRQEAQAQIKAAASPAQLTGVIKTWQQLLGGQLGGLQQQYEEGTGLKDFQRFLSPRTKQVLEPAGGGQPAQQNSAPVQVKTPQEAMALPSGTQFVTPDGRVKVRP